MATISPLMSLIHAAVRQGSRNLRRDFGEVENLQISRKGPADFVTQADKTTEAALVEELRQARPGYGFLLEEGGEIEGTDKTHRWIIDPLDGTLNFMHGVPHFSISVALEREGELYAGVVYNPVSDEMFWAERTWGAYMLDGRTGQTRKLRGANRQNFHDGLYATGIPFKGKPGHATFLKGLHKVMGQTAGVRRFGSAALDLAWVAMGRFDGFWERNLAPWDIAAGIVIAQEAGLIVEELDHAGPKDQHNPLSSGNIICTNAHLIETLKQNVSVD